MKKILLFITLIFLLGCGKDGAIGPQGEKGDQGIAGINGSTIFSGKTAPSSTIGKMGDFFLNLTNGDLYGPKSSNGWGVPFSLKGATGEQGIPGSAILSGQTVPISSVGKNGDFYINLQTMTIYGPKSNSGWGEPVSLDKNVGAEFYRIEADFSNYNYVNQDSSFGGTSKIYFIPNASGKFIEVYYLSTGRAESIDISQSWKPMRGSGKTVVNYNVFEQRLNNVYLSARSIDGGGVEFWIEGKGFAIKPDFSRPGGYLNFLIKVTDVKSIETLSKALPGLGGNQDIKTLK